MKMKAQVLYNLRETTEWISGNDLHQLFDSLTGDMSPSGYTEVSAEQAAQQDSTLGWLLNEQQFSVEGFDGLMTIEEATEKTQNRPYENLGIRWEGGDF